jgi:very-short-patch-repair endonuclease
MAHQDGSAERRIAAIAEEAHGVVTRRQLVAAGLSRDEIRHRLHSGALIREHRGVYRVGHRAPDQDASYLAAVLACGLEAALGGLAATHHYGVTKGAAPPPEVHAAVKRHVRGVIVHRTRLDRRDVTRWRGMPTVTVPRALVDVAAVLNEADLARACHEAGVRFRTTPRHVEAVLARRPNAPGAARLRAVLRGDVHVTLSALERRFLALLAEHHLPLPVTNKPAGSRRVDCRWPAVPLTVELDGYRFHASRHAWEQDHRREREARARGDDFRRFTYGDVTEDPGPMLAELEALLAGHPSAASKQ